MTNSENTMHEHFPKWYAEVSMGNDASRRKARWRGVEKMVSNLEFSDLETLFQLSFGGQAKPIPDDVTNLFAPIFGTDPAFDVIENNREVQILAAAAIVVLMDDLDAQLGNEAALGATTAAMYGQRKLNLPQDLAALGGHAIHKRGEASRKRPEAYANKSTRPFKVDVEAVRTRLSQQGVDQNTIAEEFDRFGKTVQSRFSTVENRHKSAIQSLEHFLKIQDEEMEMLWWLIGEYSSSYSCPFAKVPSKARPLVLANELAEMTKFSPGPTSINGLLSRRGLLSGKKVGVVQVVNAVREDWLQERESVDSSSKLMTPIHEAVKRRMETGKGEAWVAGWAAVTQLPESLQLTPLQIGIQFYREALYLMEF